MLVIDIVSWIAVVMLSLGYWLQVGKIHIHREVRDISLPYYLLLAVGFAILAVTAMIEGSVIFIVKQIATFVPCVVIAAQVVYHRQDRWHDPYQPSCTQCSATLETHWRACPFCGTKRTRPLRNRAS